MKTQLKAPKRPIRPQKPYPPHKDKKVNQHFTSANHLFFHTTYFDDNGKEISKEQYYRGHYAFEEETEERTPSLKDLLACVPPNTDLADVYIEIDSWHDRGRHIYNDIKVFYTTPYDYKAELDKYNKAMEVYKTDLVAYQKKMATYKEEFKQYQVLKDQERLANKKAKLQAELAALK